MDYTAITTAIISGILSIGAIAAFMAKYMPKLSAWTVLAKDAVETLADISLALKPDDAGKVELTPEEITKINNDVVAFRAQLTVLMGSK